MFRDSPMGWGLGRVPPRLGQDASRRTEETSVIPSLVGTGLGQAQCPDPQGARPTMSISKLAREAERPPADDPRRPRDRVRSGSLVEHRRKRPLLRFLPLPRCFPNPRRQGGEAKNGPEGPL